MLVEQQDDIGGGAAIGLSTVQVRTGKYSGADEKVAVQPDHRIDSIEDLPGLLGL